MSQGYFLPHEQIDALLQILQASGYRCMAPRHLNGAISYATITKASQLPWGFNDEQAAGHYRVNHDGRARAFGWVLPTTSIKPLLFKAKETLWKVQRDSQGKLEFKPSVDYEAIAVFGIRPCDLRGIAIQDRVFKENSYNDIRYVKRREQQFLIAMNCTNTHSNCFCVALGDSPSADGGYDLAMTELEGAGFVVVIGSEKGRAILAQLQLSAASGAQIYASRQGIEHAVEQQHKSLPPIHEVEAKLMANLTHPQWDDVATRCLSCGNCTQVCPTCFCHSEKDVPSLDGSDSSHTREWDSCFSLEHSYTHGQTYHDQLKYRYRQWLTHKFATWREQFKTKGCVGCGRCITWCPAKIDVVDEINAICR